MRRYFCPDYCLDTYRDATVSFLTRHGIQYLILDIDNTLAPYEQAEPDADILQWFAALDAAGIRAAFVSNNRHERVARFNRAIGIPMYAKGKKPRRRYMRLAMNRLGAVAEQTAIMGDQVFTDVWAGRRVGIRTILLPPIKDKRDLFTRFKRVLEKPILRYYRKRKGKESESSI
jgi:hypothetical protein